MAPAATATWRKFESVELVNGDNVGVVTPWDLPAQDTLDDQNKAEKISLQLLDQYTASEREVNDRRNRNYAPTLFAKEAVACAAKLSKAKLEAAMRRLFSPAPSAAKAMAVPTVRRPVSSKSCSMRKAQLGQSWDNHGTIVGDNPPYPLMECPNRPWDNRPSGRHAAPEAPLSAVPVCHPFHLQNPRLQKRHAHDCRP